MYNPSFRVKKNGVPVVSKKELDAIGERFIRDFQPDVLKQQKAVQKMEQLIIQQYVTLVKMDIM